MEDLRIGVFVCECGHNIAGTVDCEAVRAHASTLPNVAIAQRNRYTCSDPGQQQIKQAIADHNLNRIVVASCTPRLHEPTFRKCLSEAGMNPYLLDMANIREQCSWVHQSDPVGATHKALDAVTMAVARARFLKSQKELEVPVSHAALIIGGGIAGIQAALDLADAGHQVYLVEKQPSIGGKMAQLDKTFPTMDCSI